MLLFYIPGFAGIMMSRLSATIYPEYAKVFQYMTGKDGHPNYVRMPSTYVRAIDESTVILETPTGEVWVGFGLYQPAYTRFANY